MTDRISQAMAAIADRERQRQIQREIVRRLDEAFRARYGFDRR